MTVSVSFVEGGHNSAVQIATAHVGWSNRNRNRTRTIILATAVHGAFHSFALRAAILASAASSQLMPEFQCGTPPSDWFGGRMAPSAAWKNCTMLRRSHSVFHAVLIGRAGHSWPSVSQPRRRPPNKPHRSSALERTEVTHVPCSTAWKNKMEPVSRPGLTTCSSSSEEAAGRGSGYCALWLPGMQTKPPEPGPNPARCMTEPQGRQMVEW